MRPLTLNWSSAIRLWSISWQRKGCGFSMQDISVFLQWKNCSSSSGSIQSIGSINAAQTLMSAWVFVYIWSNQNPTARIGFAEGGKVLKRIRTSYLNHNAVLSSFFRLPMTFGKWNVNVVVLTTCLEAAEGTAVPDNRKRSPQCVFIVSCVVWPSVKFTSWWGK